MQMQLTPADLKAMNSRAHNSVKEYHIQKIKSNPTLKQKRLVSQRLYNRKTSRTRSNELDYKILQDIWLQNNRPTIINIKE